MLVTDFQSPLMIALEQQGQAVVIGVSAGPPLLWCLAGYPFCFATGVVVEQSQCALVVCCSGLWAG